MTNCPELLVWFAGFTETGLLTFYAASVMLFCRWGSNYLQIYDPICGHELRVMTHRKNEAVVMSGQHQFSLQSMWVKQGEDLRKAAAPFHQVKPFEVVGALAMPQCVEGTPGSSIWQQTRTRWSGTPSRWVLHPERPRWEDVRHVGCLV